MFVLLSLLCLTYATMALALIGASKPLQPRRAVVPVRVRNPR